MSAISSSPSALDVADASTPATAPPRKLTDRLTILWILNFLAIAALATWVVADRSAGQMLRVAAPAPDTTWFPAPTASVVQSRGTALLAGVAVGLVGFGLVSLMLFFLGLLFGDRHERSLRSWLAFTALVAMWAGLSSSCDELAWMGESRRMRRQVPKFESVAARLRADFPVRDGRLPELGDFTAYPVGQPQLLLMFIAETPPGRSTIAGVERSPAGALRFVLASEQLGEWLEWHPAGSKPASFNGTLSEYRLNRSTALGDGWYLTRYE